MNISKRYVFEIIERTVTPSLESEIAVTTDDNARRILYRIPAVIDGFDVSSGTFLIRYINAAGENGEYEMTNIEFRSGDDGTYIYAEWIMGSEVAKKTGTVYYDVVIKVGDNYEWHSLIDKFEVEKGLSDMLNGESDA